MCCSCWTFRPRSYDGWSLPSTTSPRYGFFHGNGNLLENWSPDRNSHTVYGRIIPNYCSPSLFSPASSAFLCDVATLPVSRPPSPPSPSLCASLNLSGMKWNPDASSFVNSHFPVPAVFHRLPDGGDRDAVQWKSPFIDLFYSPWSGTMVILANATVMMGISHCKTRQLFSFCQISPENNSLTWCKLTLQLKNWPVPDHY